LGVIKLMAHMSSASDRTNLTPKEMADLSALADGTLDRSRRAEVEAWIEASPHLSALYARERRVVEALRDARRERAPERLRARIEASRPSARKLARLRAGYLGGAATALAAIVLALALILPSGSPGSPSISQAAALALRGPAQPAPPPDPRYPDARLGTDIQEVYFPNWGQALGWRAVGQRSDTINGRSAVTVYYQRGAWRIAYTIVGAPALAEPAAQVTYLKGLELRTLSMGGRLVVTWRRAGHTCVLSGRGVPAARLQHLAAWQARPTTD
jgi:hypothetical protein